MQEGEKRKYDRLGMSETIVIVSLLFLGGPDMTQSLIIGCTFIAVVGGLCSLGSYAARHVLRFRLGKRYFFVEMIIVTITAGVVFIGSYISIGEVKKAIVSSLLVVLLSSLLWLAMFAGRRRLLQRQK